MRISSKAMIDLYKYLSRCATERGHVFLVYRLNNDEQQVGGMFAAPYKEEREKIIQDIKPMNVMKLQLTSDKRFKNVRFNDGPRQPVPTSALRGTEKADKQGGGHAEEMFLQFFLAKRRDCAISTAEVMLSRIPCPSTSPAWYLGDQEGDLPAGCGPKLLEVIKRYPSIKWVIAYEEIFRSSLSVMGEINAQRNAQSGALFSMVQGF